MTPKCLREDAAPFGELDAAGRVPAQPGAPAGEANPDGKLAIAGTYDADQLRRRRHPPAADAGAQWCR